MRGSGRPCAKHSIHIVCFSLIAKDFIGEEAVTLRGEVTGGARIGKLRLCDLRGPL